MPHLSWQSSHHVLQVRLAYEALACITTSILAYMKQLLYRVQVCQLPACTFF